jgi:small subunit ribosomal protein S1
MAKFRFIEFEDDDELKNNEGQTPEAESFAALLDAQNASVAIGFREPKVSDKVSGTVVSLSKDSLFVDIGAKQPGVLALSAFSDVPCPSVGDTLELFVKSVDASEIHLARSLNADGAAREALLAARTSGAPVEAKVEKAVNGGYQAKIGTIRAFIPISHMLLPEDSLPSAAKSGANATGAVAPSGSDPDPFVGKTLSFQVLEVKEGGRNILLSRRALLRAAREEERNQCLATLREGETRTVTITRLADFGAFARLGPGLDGLIPLGELAWKRVNRAADVVKEGDVVAAKILKITLEPQVRIALSLKDAGADPWESVERNLPAGHQLQGTVTRLADFGAFVEVQVPGEPQGQSLSLEGLVPIGELSWSKRIRHVGDILRPGQNETFTVLRVEPERRRLALSLRGPMPEELRARAEKAARAAQDRTGQSPEDAELAAAWKDYESQKAQGPKTTSSAPREPAAGGATSLAAAFATAKKRNKS